MSTAVARGISGPVLRARPQGPFVLREAVSVGERGLLGEVIRVREDEIVIQVYEDTTGLRVGTLVTGSGQPLSIRLGPGLLGKIFDGLLRPSWTSADPFVTPGQQEEEQRSFPFVPRVAVGERLGPGAVFATVHPPDGVEQHCLVPPELSGEVASVRERGDYADDLTVLKLRAESGQVHDIAMRHPWSVRVPRPVAARLPADEPLLTGQRILDCVFPVARGGKAAIPGGFGTGKTVLLETLAKWCDADVIVYVGCGERGNEIAGLLEEFGQLEDPRTGRLLMERAVIIANTSNMPVAAREASIYTGVTVAEYFRDQGKHVALFADSTSRWAEALREISGRLGELPGEGGYPAYLSSRLAEFYERAARVRTLGGEIGSVTLIGAISPPSGDFSEPVTSHTRRYVRSLWMLDAHRAHARFYPAIHPLHSYSMDADAMAKWWHQRGCVRWEELRRRFLVLLEEQARLDRMARIIGTDAMPPRQRTTLMCAELVNEAFLRQSAYSPIDRFASPTRQAVMMRLLGRFLDLAEEAVAAGVTPEALADLEIHRRILRLGEEIGEGEWAQFSAARDQLEKAIAGLLEQVRDRRGDARVPEINQP
ncbi:MAG: V-type ATP synthase subunit A [Pseudomonadota bacterium]|nr:V-type ATP synthase subunit A [Pseudomonadota bacterium]